MTIFQTYTGNAMLNNALMTIEALAKLSDISEVNPSLLLELYRKCDLKSTNKRLKSYTMLFTKNGPLHNDKTNGDRIYESLLNTIISNYENDGPIICEISGLRFKSTFSNLYELALKNVGFSEKEIKSKDTNISRTWFPLIGGLGSDAQALPQAKFTVQIHPICIAILQFLPLSAVLYKGGILLVDSSNFGLSREMVSANVKTLSEKIQAVSSKESVENVRDFAKGDYLLKALSILTEKEDYEETYSDLNMWSFSNSGTGASCEIDRVPNALIRKLQRLLRRPTVSTELKGILSRNESAYSFLDSLEGNKDWFLLYPNVFGSGKKATKYDGVTAEFLEAYYNAIEKAELIPTAKYIAGLIEKYKSRQSEKILDKTDAWGDSEYKLELFKVLVKATENSEWNLEQHIAILDNTDELPIKNNYYQYQKLIHYFTQKKIQSDTITKVDILNTRVFNACKWIIGLIQKDEKVNTIKSNLTNPNENQKVGFNRVTFDALDKTEVKFEDIVEIFYDEDYNFRKYGLNELLRIFFSQPNQETFEFRNLKNLLKNKVIFRNWMNRIQEFANDYQTYFYANNFNLETGKPSYKKFKKTINALVKENDNFYSLLNEVIYNTNHHIKQAEQNKKDKWSIEELMTNPLGNSNHNICTLAVKFLLKQTAISPIKESLTNVN
ncbi:hypothetical protein [Sphingobacterium sp. LRF_L2]|uniref:hypothetical protein n=1 Tax=Sphingobacterium sp. LRF_L2 TaxID=3369421 RepID=UPI003F638E6A